MGSWIWNRYSVIDAGTVWTGDTRVGEVDGIQYLIQHAIAGNRDRLAEHVQQGKMERCLIIVDVQNDFLPGGALAVPEGDAVLPVINALEARFSIVVATQDWHPADHASFAANHPGKRPFETIELNGLAQTLWPVHCVQGTAGAQLAPGLRKEAIVQVFQKGAAPGIDSYSGFFDNGHRKGTGLNKWLKTHGIGEVYVCGLATEYCVKFTALDAVQLGFKTHVIEDATRGVNLRPDDVSDALRQLRQVGVEVIQSAEFL